MFTAHVTRLRSRVDLVRRSLRVNDSLRKLLQSPGFVLEDLSCWESWEQSGLVGAVFAHAPTDTSWRDLDHATAVTTLYAAFEGCVYEMLREWIIDHLPVVFRDYTGGDDPLPDKSRSAHRHGFAELLKFIERPRYQHLSLPLILQQYAEAEAGASPYSLVPEAFFMGDENVRSGRLDSLFATAGIPDVWVWLRKHPLLRAYAREYLEGVNTLEGELNELVDYRNVVSHRTPQERLSTTRLLRYTDYIEHLATALAELLQHHVYRYYLRRCVGRAETIGEVRRVFDRRHAVVCRMKACTVKLGEAVILMADDFCTPDSVLGLHQNMNPVDEATVAEGDDLSFKFTALPKKGVRVIRLVQTSVPLDYVI